MLKRIIIGVLILSGLSVEAQKLSIYRVTKMLFNTKSFSEIAPVITNNGVFFCSDRRFSFFKDRTTFDNDRLYSLYFSKQIDTAKWKTEGVIKSEINYLFNTGPLCISSDGRTAYFTSEIEQGNPSKRKSFRNHNGIYIANLSSTSLTSIRPFQYNNAEYEVGQPSISKDGKYLFFSSDMPGGKGGSDIYFCELVNGQWSTPVNLSLNINSTRTDCFPFIHPSGRLFFSSNREGGMGKMDIYYTIKTNGEWEAPVMLQEPINSREDDFAFVSDDNLMTGYFTSTRERSDDIYEFVSTMVRKATCNEQLENSYCFEFTEENAVKFDTIPFRYEWKFGDGTAESGPVVEHCFPGPGSYRVQLDVVNLITKEVMANEKSFTMDVTDEVQPFITCPEQEEAGQLVRFSAEKTNLPDWNIVRYYWNFGDETVAIGKDVDKVYKRPGTYSVQLIVTSAPGADGFASEACVSKNIIIIR